MGIRVGVIDPCRLFREGLGKLLEELDLEVVVSASTFAEVLKESPEHLQVVLWGFDPETETNNRLADLHRARADFPGLRTVVLAHALDHMLLTWAATSGINAVLSKDISAEILRRSLELVMLGQELFPALTVTMPGAGEPFAARMLQAAAAPVVVDLPVRGPDLRRGTNGESQVGLSDREDQILRRLAAGAPNKLIARDLGITEGTVKVHIKSLLRKLGAANRTQAAIWSIDRGLARGNPAAPLERGVNGSPRAPS